MAKQNSFLIYHCSGWYIVLLFVIGFGVPVYMEEHFSGLLSEGLFFGVLLVTWLLLVWLLIRYFLLKTIEVIIEEDRISFTYLNRDLDRRKRSRSIKFENIERLNNISNRAGFALKIYFKSGRTFMLTNASIFFKPDDLSNVGTSLRTQIEEFNRREVALLKEEQDTSAIQLADESYFWWAITLFICAFICGFLVIISLFQGPFQPICLLGVIAFSAGGYYKLLQYRGEEKL